MTWRNKLFYGAVAIAALAVNTTFAQYSEAVMQWAPAVNAACAAYGCDSGYLLHLINCESGGDPGAVSEAINPGTGTHDYGLLQISTIWGGQNMGPEEQIAFAAQHAGRDVWWAC